MKRMLIALLAVVVASGAFAQTQFPDIPDNHWAEDAVARIADLGIVIGFPDGTYRGNEAFTRYQAALVVSRLLDVINANIETMQAMTEADIASLRNALQELASDLAAQGVRVAALESAVAGLADDTAALTSDVAALGNDVASLGNDVDTLANGVAGLGDDVASNSARIAALEAAMEGMDRGVDEAVIRDLQNQIAALRVTADTAAAQAAAAAESAAAAAAAAAGAEEAAGASAGSAADAADAAGGAANSADAAAGSANAAADDAAAAAASADDAANAAGGAANAANAAAADAANAVGAADAAAGSAAAAADDAAGANSAAGAAANAAEAAAGAADAAADAADTAVGAADAAAGSAAAAADDAAGANSAAGAAANAAEAAAGAADAAADAADTAVGAADAAAGAADAAAGSAAAAADDAAGANTAAGAAANAAEAAVGAANAAADDAAAAAEGAAAANTRAGQALAQANENAAQIAAVNSVLNLFNDRIAALEGAEPAGDTIINQVDDEAIARNASDIANIREFVVLLRRDQVALRDAVNALQESDAAQAADIADLLDRVDRLENNPLGLTGTIEFDYYVGRVDGTPFDQDRAYGLNNDRDIGESTFSSGEGELDDDDDDLTEGEFAQDLEDITAAFGNFDVTLDIELENALSFDGLGSPNALNSFEVVVEFAFALIDLIDEDETIAVLTLDEFIAIADFIGADPITLILGEDVEVTFTDNIVDLSDDYEGVYVHLGTPEFLAFANPDLFFFYLTDTSDETDAAAVPAQADTAIYARGVRGTASFFDGISGGVSFAQRAETGAGGSNPDDIGNIDDDNIETTIIGVDAQAVIGPLELVAEFATSSQTGDVTNYSDDILMVEASVDVGSIGVPILDTLWVAYLDYAEGWFAEDPDEVSADSPIRGRPALSDEGAHEDDQVGFFGTAGFDIFGLLDLEAYVDSYSLNSVAANSSFNFGVDATAGLPLGFELTAFYHSASINGTAVDDLEDGIDGTEAVVVAGMDRDENRDTGFGVGLTHDGDGDNALIDRLNLEFAFEITEADSSKTYILAAADYELAISIVTLTPYVKYESETDSDVGGNDDFTTIAAGTGLETAELDIFLRPSLEAAVNYRNTDHSNADVFTSNELQYSVALRLNEFLMEHTTLTARYGSWTGMNINDDLNTVGVGDSATDISNGDENNGFTQSVNGYEVILNFYDAEFAYGVYTSDSDTGTPGGISTAQAFTISYVIDW